MKRISALLCVALLMTACATPLMRDAGLDKFAPRKAEKDLSSGIRAYEEGEYKSTTRLLQSALSAGLLLNSDKVAAHKYLAFVHCAQSREKLCREEFRKALELDPGFELTPAESGHPSWGPVFRSLKP
ncbi:MAG TPA: TssQ family T6SS-associated lipoprotein [Thiobacillus sp.]|nr:TssQ family T6SS-associated lipoprotein [Thiobacillus sp.]HQT68934.1 TssQ family T6SS-associated lipoprotein [Thiobacillus sp.]